MDPARAQAIETALAHFEGNLRGTQPESIPLLRPLLTAAAGWEERLPLPRLQTGLIGELAGLYCTGLHGVLLRGERVSLPDLRAHLSDLLDEVEGMMAVHGGALLDDEALFIPPRAPEVA